MTLFDTAFQYALLPVSPSRLKAHTATDLHASFSCVAKVTQRIGFQDFCSSPLRVQSIAAGCEHPLSLIMHVGFCWHFPVRRCETHGANPSSHRTHVHVSFKTQVLVYFQLSGCYRRGFHKLEVLLLAREPCMTQTLQNSMRGGSGARRPLSKLKLPFPGNVTAVSPI